MSEQSLDWHLASVNSLDQLTVPFTSKPRSAWLEAFSDVLIEMEHHVHNQSWGPVGRLTSALRVEVYDQTDSNALRTYLNDAVARANERETTEAARDRAATAQGAVDVKREAAKAEARRRRLEAEFRREE